MLPTSPPTLILRALGGDAHTTSTTLAFSDLFPTTTASTTTGTGTDGDNRIAKSAPSLYLIIFLSILVVLLLTSTAIALRAIHLRRRFRTEIQRALARGSIHPWEAQELQRQREADAWGLGRWAGWAGWETDVIAGQTGQRRKKREKLGPRPVLWEFELVDEKDEWRELNPISIQCISTSTSSPPPPSTTATLPFSTQTIHTIDTAFNPFLPSSSLDDPIVREGRRLSINDDQFIPPGGGRGIAIRRPESRTRQQRSLRDVTTGRAVNTLDAIPNQDEQTVGFPKPGEHVQAGFIILMPEPDEMRKDNQMLLSEDERSHGAMELGIWLGRVENENEKVERRKGREERLDEAKERFEDAGV